MSNSKVNRLNELNKLWFRLHTPKIGDKVKFKIQNSDEIHEGTITGVQKSGNQYKFNMVADGLAPAGMNSITIIECNGIKFEEIENPYLTDQNNFKPI